METPTQTEVQRRKKDGGKTGAAGVAIGGDLSGGGDVDVTTAQDSGGEGGGRKGGPGRKVESNDKSTATVISALPPPSLAAYPPSLAHTLSTLSSLASSMTTTVALSFSPSYVRKIMLRVVVGNFDRSADRDGLVFSASMPPPDPNSLRQVRLLSWNIDGGAVVGFPGAVATRTAKNSNVWARTWRAPVPSKPSWQMRKRRR